MAGLSTSDIKGINLGKSSQRWNGLFSTLIDTGQIPAFSAAGFVYTGFTIAGLHVGWVSLLASYLLAIIIYWHDYSKDRDLNKKTAAWMSRLFWMCPALLFALLLSGHRFSGLLFSAGLLILGMAYAKYLKPVSSRITGFKDFFVSIMWTLLLVNASLCERIGWTFSLTMAAAFLFLSAFINVATCDIKDINEDSRNGIRTLAVALGLKRLRCFLDLLNIVSGVLILAGIYLHVLVSVSWVLLLSIPYVFVYTRLAGGADACMLYSSTASVSGWQRWCLHSVLIDGNHLWTALLIWTVTMFSVS